MENQQVADNRFLQVLTLDGYSLSDPQASYPFVPFLKDGAEFPEFFNDDSGPSDRTIKQLIDDPHSNLRIVYFEVFRLADETDDDSFLTNLKRRVFSLDFDIMFTPETEAVRSVFNDFQFKRFFAEFVTIFEQNAYQPIYELIQKYPLMDQVFIHILRSILASRGIEESFETRIPTETVFAVLGKELGLDIVGYGNCWKFEDADMVCYEGPEGGLYIVYSVKPNVVVQKEEVGYKTGSNLEGYIQNFSPSVQYTTAPITTTTTTYTSQPLTYTSTPSYTPSLNNNYPTTTSYDTPTYYPTSTSSYEPYTYTTKPIESASSSINLDIYQTSEKDNALVNKYLNISTNPEDILGSATNYRTTTTTTETFTTSPYYTPSKIDNTYDKYTASSYETSYKVDQPLLSAGGDYNKYANYASQETNSLLEKYSNPSYSGLESSFGGLSIGDTSSYSLSTNYATTTSVPIASEYSTSSYTTSSYATGDKYSSYDHPK